jgi:hypothetical protein
MAGAEQQLSCKKCGSVYFQEAEFREYFAGGSVDPTRELYPMPGGQVCVRVCLCGHPMPRRAPDGDTRERFQSSLKAALEFRSAGEPEAMRRQLDEEYANRKELSQVQAYVKELKAIVADRETALARLEKEPAKGTSKETAGKGGSVRARAARKRKKSKVLAKPRRKARR